MSQEPTLSFAVHSRSGLEVYNGVENPRMIAKCTTIDRDVAPVYSPDGQSLAYYDVDDKGVVLQDSEFKHPKRIIQTDAKVLEVSFSTKGTYIVLWHREDKRRGEFPNLQVFKTEDGSLVASFVQKRWPAILWNYNESLCVRFMSGSAYVVPGHSLLTEAIDTLSERVTDFSISSATTSGLAVMVPAKEGAPSAVCVYQLPNLHKPFMVHPFSKADNAELLWNSVGNLLLVHAKTDIDDTGRSYYGNSALYLLTLPTQQVWHVRLGSGERIHAVQWSPDGREFIVVYGEMPGNKCTLFNSQAEPVHSFPVGPRNTISYSPFGRFIMIAGFGNLNGEMDLWDREKLGSKGTGGKLGKMSHTSVTLHEWSPDSRYIMTCVCAPRMRVDNRLVIWKHNSQLLFQNDYDELFRVVWAPIPITSFQRRDPSPLPMGHSTVTIGGKKEPTKAQVYRHASSSAVSDAIRNYKSTSTSSYVARTAAVGSWGDLGQLRSAFNNKASNDDPDLIPGMSQEMLKRVKEAKAKAEAKKNAAAKAAAKASDKDKSESAPRPKGEAKPKPKAKPKAKDEEHEAEGDNAGGDADKEKIKKAKALRKKIKEIQELQGKDASELDNNQKKKVASLDGLIQELADLTGSRE